MSQNKTYHIKKKIFGNISERIGHEKNNNSEYIYIYILVDWNVGIFVIPWNVLKHVESSQKRHFMLHLEQNPISISLSDFQIMLIFFSKKKCSILCSDFVWHFVWFDLFSNCYSLFFKWCIRHWNLFQLLWLHIKHILQ